jgi:putative flippase GtrA
MKQIMIIASKLPIIRALPEKTIEKLFLYVVIGMLTLFINFGFLYFFRQVVKFLDLVAVMLSFAFTAMCHFLLHNAITFRKSTEAFGHKITGHLLVSVFNYFIGVSVAMLVIRFVCDSNLLAAVCSAAVTFIVGFVSLHRLVYKTHKENEEDDHNKKST